MSDSCVTTSTGDACLAPSTWALCRPWQLTQQQRTNCYADSLVQESLSIAGADIHVFRLLGVHEQTKLVDNTGNGSPIVSSSFPGFDADQAFNIYATEWRSLEAGSKVVDQAFIGYDFGVVKLPNGRVKYGSEANVRVHITSLKIKQSVDPMKRVSKARVERSDNGVEWYGVSVVSLPVDDSAAVVSFKESVPSRYWRLRPLQFVGGSCDVWGVQALELSEYTATTRNNIQDFIWMENRDREYATPHQVIKGYYDVVTSAIDLSRFGSELPTLEYQIKVNFNACVNLIGRPIVVGDIVELPSETQYTASLRPVRKFFEVTDVAWDSSSFTPGWMPTMLSITTQPAVASQETQDIFGHLAAATDASGLFNRDDGNSETYQDFSAVDQHIVSVAHSRVPEIGAEGSNVVREFTPSELESSDAKGYTSVHKLQFQRKDVFVEDGMPQNGAPYTEGPEYPLRPSDGDYHRMTYEGTASDIPVRLYRYSSAKGRWIYLETDKRSQYTGNKQVIEEYITSPHSTNRRTAGNVNQQEDKI